MPLNATPVTKEGSVLKKKQKNLGLSGWKKRWFVLKEGCLSYYTKKHGKFLGEFNLVAVSVNPCVVVKGKVSTLAISVPPFFKMSLETLF